jgi:hypothetical protein
MLEVIDAWQGVIVFGFVGATIYVAYLFRRRP